MKLITLVLVTWTSLAVSASNPVPLLNKALSVNVGTDIFAKCVANAAVAQVLHQNPFYNSYSFKSLLTAETIASPVGGPAASALLKFWITNDESGGLLFVVQLRSLDVAQGWQLEQGSSGEIYPISTSVDTSAVLLTSHLHGVGSFDISICN